MRSAHEDQLEALTEDVERRLVERFPLHAPQVYFEIWDPGDRQPSYSLVIEIPTGREAEWYARTMLPPPATLRGMNMDYAAFITETIAMQFETVAASLN